MATGDVTTVSFQVNSSNYVVLVDGSVHSIAGIQVDYSGDPIRLVIADDGGVAVDTQNFIVLSRDTPPFREALSATTVIWGLAYFNSNARARIYQVER